MDGRGVVGGGGWGGWGLGGDGGAGVAPGKGVIDPDAVQDRTPFNAIQPDTRSEDMKDDIVIVSAARTPVGAFNGVFATLPAHDLGKVAIQEALKRAGVEGGQVAEVTLGQILTAAQGQNPARQSSIAAGIPVASPAWGVNQLCGSGLRTVALGYPALLNPDSELAVAGGQESMSMAPPAQYLRSRVKRGPG